MGWLRQRRSRPSSPAAKATVTPASLTRGTAADPDRPSETPRRLSLPTGVEPFELHGTDELQVAWETFHADAILAAQLSASPHGPMTAVLVPEPDNPRDPNAVAVYLQHEHVGFLPREVARRMQPTLLAFAAANGGRPVSCAAHVNWGGQWTQVILNIDLARLSVDPAEVVTVPDLDLVIQRLLPRLDDPHIPLTGTDPKAREALAVAEDERAVVDADYSRDRRAWPRVEHDFRRAAEQLERTRDPLVSDAWLGVARATRYQPDHRDETLEAAVEALHWNRANEDAWSELIDMASAAPHVPTLMALFERVPADCRLPVLRQLISLSRGHDRRGRMSPGAGERLRAELQAFAESQGDTASCAILAGRRRR